MIDEDVSVEATPGHTSQDISVYVQSNCPNLGLVAICGRSIIVLGLGVGSILIRVIVVKHRLYLSHGGKSWWLLDTWRSMNEVESHQWPSMFQALKFSCFWLLVFCTRLLRSCYHDIRKKVKLIKLIQPIKSIYLSRSRMFSHCQYCRGCSHTVSICRGCVWEWTRFVRSWIMAITESVSWNTTKI